MKDYNAIADQWVGAFVDENVRKRIFDGRPDRIFVKTLTLAIGELLQRECAEVAAATAGAVLPAPKGVRKAKGA